MFDTSFTALLFIALVLNASGFLLRDELRLRLFIVAGGSFQIAFYALQSPAIVASVITHSILIAINLVLIGIITLERSTLFMTAQQSAAFRHFKTLTPGQFRRINRVAEWVTAEEDTEILTQGEPSDMLYFLDMPEFGIVKYGREYSAKGPAFAGEIMLLQGGAASATVMVPAGSTYARFPVRELKRLMKRSRPLENALLARFGQDLAQKVRNSVPVDQVVDVSDQKVV